MKRGTRRLAAALLSLVLFALAGCAPKALPEASAPAEAAGAALTVCLGEDLGPLDPQLALDTGELALSRLLYEGLMRPDGAGGWTCGAAESYRLSEDGKTCTLTLRRDALWSDGVPVTAQDFVYAWERLLAPESASPYALDAALWIEGGEASLYGEEGAALGVRALDDKTLEVRLTARCPYLDALLALPALAPRRSEADALYNGPYGLEAAEADVLRLRRSPTYWDRENVLPEEIAVRAYASGEEAVRALRAGELDLSLFYPAGALPALQEEGFARLSAEDCVLYLDLNAAAPPLDDPLVRQALALALDADALLGAADLPGARAADSLYPPGIGGAEAGAAAVPSGGRAAQAQAALAEAGYPGGEGFPELELLALPEDVESGLAEALCTQWREVLGVRVHAAERDAAGAAQARMDGAFSLAIGSFFNAYGDAQALWDMDMRLSGLARESEALARALDDLAGARSESARRAALRRAEAAVVEEARCVPLCATQRAWLCRPEWAGVALTPAGDLLLCRARRADAQE